MNQRHEEGRHNTTVALVLAILIGAAFLGYLVTIRPPLITTSSSSAATTATSSTSTHASTTSSPVTFTTTTTYTSKVMGYSGFIKESLNVTDYNSTNYRKLNVTLNIVFPMSFTVNSSGNLVVLPPQNATYSGYYSEVLNNMTCAPHGSNSNTFSGSLSGHLTFGIAAQFNKTQGVVVLQFDQWGGIYGNGLPDRCSGSGPAFPSTPDNGLGAPGYLLLGQVMGPNESSGVMSQIGKGQRIYSNPYDGAFYGFLLNGYQGQSLNARYSGLLAYWHCTGESACGGGFRDVSYVMVVNLNFSS